MRHAAAATIAHRTNLRVVAVLTVVAEVPMVAEAIQVVAVAATGTRCTPFIHFIH